MAASARHACGTCLVLGTCRMWDRRKGATVVGRRWLHPFLCLCAKSGLQQRRLCCLDLHRVQRPCSSLLLSHSFCRPGTIMFANLIEPGFEPSALRPIPVDLRQLLSVVKALVVRALTQNRFPGIHSAVPPFAFP